LALDATHQRLALVEVRSYFLAVKHL
jgi:hypothetical protein